MVGWLVGWLVGHPCGELVALLAHLFHCCLGVWLFVRLAGWLVGGFTWLLALLFAGLGVWIGWPLVAGPAKFGALVCW